MARTNIVANAAGVSLLTSYPTLPIGSDAATPSFTSTSDVAISRQTALIDGKTMVLAYNSGTIAHTISFTSIVDSLNRAGDIETYSVKPASAAVPIAIFGPFKSPGWAQTGNVLFIDYSDKELQVAVLTLP
jgi:hypothetical protein